MKQPSTSDRGLENGNTGQTPDDTIEAEVELLADELLTDQNVGLILLGSDDANRARPILKRRLGDYLLWESHDDGSVTVGNSRFLPKDEPITVSTYTPVTGWGAEV